MHLIVVGVVSIIVGLTVGSLGVALVYERKMSRESETNTPYKPVRTRRPILNLGDQLDPIKPEPERKQHPVFQKGIILNSGEEYDE